MATYCFEYKKKIVTEYLQGKGSCKELASKYSIDFTNIRHWVRNYNAKQAFCHIKILLRKCTEFLSFTC